MHPGQIVFLFFILSTPTNTVYPEPGRSRVEAGIFGFWIYILNHEIKGTVQKFCKNILIRFLVDSYMRTSTPLSRLCSRYAAWVVDDYMWWKQTSMVAKWSILVLSEIFVIMQQGVVQLMLVLWDSGGGQKYSIIHCCSSEGGSHFWWRNG